MIQEAYVSFETAKLLKEKGFDGEFHKHYWGYEEGRELSQFTARELIDELKLRGFSGTLTYSRDVTI